MSRFVGNTEDMFCHVETQLKALSMRKVILTLSHFKGSSLVE